MDAMRGEAHPTDCMHMTEYDGLEGILFSSVTMPPQILRFRDTDFSLFLDVPCSTHQSVCTPFRPFTAYSASVANCLKVTARKA
jgi:hypothetical protein